MQKIAHFLNSVKQISVVIHQKPDGDAIGSAVALVKALEQKEKNAEIVCATPIPEIFEQIVGKVKVNKSLDLNCEAVIIVDCSELHRTGIGRQLKRKKRPTIIAIDHHTNGNISAIADFEVIDPKAAASAEIVYDLIKEMRSFVTPQIATSLLMGIYTDCGAFQHNNTTSKTLQLSGRLIREGADLQKIVTTFMRTLTQSKKRLWGKVIAEAKLNNFGVVTAVISLNDLKIAKASEEDINGLANVLSLANEAKAALVLSETKDGWRGVLRTRHANINLKKLARFLGGRGQKKAAGFLATKSIFSGKIIK
ncbi:bifunctional oligoribonuclease/PAP phosphatase NrnA [Candidatus Berkelbacteria bacterium]|nr:bifunctional oligoribonuclease/PAP phosphatase NrnA [Candidatus Berkelbacteria bacterium]